MQNFYDFLWVIRYDKVNIFNGIVSKFKYYLRPAFSHHI